MQFSIDSIYRTIEERFGRTAGTLLLVLIYGAVVVFCISTIWLWGVKPAYDGVSVLLQGDGTDARSYLLQIVGAVVVVTILLGLQTWVTAHLIMRAVETRLAAHGVVEKAALVFQFQQKPPYWLPQHSAYRVGILNKGPVAAMDTKAFLTDVTPTNPLPEDLLPCLLYWKEGDLKQNITVSLERHVELLRYQISTIGGRGEVLSVYLNTIEGLGSFEPSDGSVLYLHVQVAALNAHATTCYFSVRKVGMGVVVEEASESEALGQLPRSTIAPTPPSI